MRDWLIESGVNETAIAHSDNKGWIAVNVPAKLVEDLFQSELYEYESKAGSVRLGCHEYRLPAHLVDHIDFVTPGVKMTATLKKRVRRSQSWGPPSHHRRPGPGRDPNPHWGGPHHSPPHWHGELPEDVRYCGGNITPPCWRYLYKLPFPHINDSVNAAGLYEQGDYFSQSDIDMYFDKYAPYVPSDYSPHVVSVDGGEAPVAADDPNNGGEADLDIDIVTALIYPQSVVVYQVDDANYAPQEVAADNTFNTFLDAIDGSYCNYTAYGITGNTPGIDPTYPDPAENGYKGQLQCGVYKLTRVVSISFGEGEFDLPRNYQLRQCNEFMKLGLQGHTILIATGDYGVGSFPGDNSESGCLGPNEDIFNPAYPNNCPWVTSVGGTMLGPNYTVNDPESTMQVSLYRPGGPEADKYFSSAGGFSNYFPTPDYQKRTVEEWFHLHNQYPTYVANANTNVTNVGANGGRYNRAGRAYPDVSANGAYMPLFNNGTQYVFYGTSLSSPVMAGVITLINQQRTIAGKGPVGFLNNAIYSNPWMFNDITNGTNANCKSNGFPAVRGWDPVSVMCISKSQDGLLMLHLQSTGVGTPNYPKMLKYFLSLP